MKTFLQKYLATSILAVELTTLGAVIVFMITATLGHSGTMIA